MAEEEDVQQLRLRLARAESRAAELQAAEYGLRESEQRFRLFVENVHEYALIEVSVDGSIISWNPGAERMFGYSSSEVAGVPFSTLVAAGAAQQHAVKQEINEVLHGLRREEAQWLLKKDGSRFWARWVSETIYGADRRVRGIAKVMRDETERQKSEDEVRRSLAEKEELLKEVHHRVKNNLQVIASLMNLQASQMVDEAVVVAFDETRNRVHSIAAIHEILYRSGTFEAIDMVDYANRLIPNVLSMYGAEDRIGTQICGTGTLELERAVPFGLLLNELVSNVCRHAFPQEKAGKLSVSVNDESGHIVVTVQDNGVGLPPGFDVGRASSLGLKLVHNLTRQLRGSIDILAVGGTIVKVTIPARPETTHHD